MTAEAQSGQTVGGEAKANKTVLIHELPDHLHAVNPQHATNPSPALSAGNTAPLVASPQPTVDPQARTGEEPAAGGPVNKTALIHELPDPLHNADDQWDPTGSPALSSEGSEISDLPSEATPEPETQLTDGEAAGYPTDLAGAVESWVEPEVPVEDQPGTIDEWGVRAGAQVGPAGPGGAPGSGNQGGRRKVLVIDDDATMRMVLKLGLRSHGYDCLMAENGKEAQTVLQNHRPDLILVDLMMPVMDGLTFIQWLRQTAGDSTPVLVFTNVNTPQVTEEALASGANAFACKPLHLRDLVEVMNQLVTH